MYAYADGSVYINIRHIEIECESRHVIATCLNIHEEYQEHQELTTLHNQQLAGVGGVSEFFAATQSTSSGY